MVNMATVGLQEANVSLYNVTRSDKTVVCVCVLKNSLQITSAVTPLSVD